MKPAPWSICVVLAVVGISCSARLPAIVQDMQAATGREEQVRILNRIATNAQERTELFAYMDARPESVAAAKSKLLAFYADRSNQMAQLPVPLDLRSSSAPRQTCAGLNYTFSSPWPEFAETDGCVNVWVAFQDQHGRMLMMSQSTTTNALDDFAWRELSFATHDSRWIQTLAFPDRESNHGLELYRQCLGTTPSDLSACTKISDAFQYLARMSIKLILLSGKAAPVLNEVQTGAHQGYQVQDASKPGRYHLRLFDKSGRILELVFGSKQDRDPPISQADVNCVLLSLKKIDDAAPPPSSSP